MDNLSTYELLEQVYMIYEGHLDELGQYPELAEQVAQLSREFVEAHDEMLRCLANKIIPTDGMSERSFAICHKIMDLLDVTRGSGSTADPRPEVSYSLSFEVTASQREQVRQWLDQTVYPEMVRRQKAAIKKPCAVVRDCWEQGYPYEGASGGGLSYRFSPTGIGLITTAVYMDHELDLTDYSTW